MHFLAALSLILPLTHADRPPLRVVDVSGVAQIRSGATSHWRRAAAGDYLLRDAAVRTGRRSKMIISDQLDRALTVDRLSCVDESDLRAIYNRNQRSAKAYGRFRLNEQRMTTTE